MAPGHLLDANDVTRCSHRVALDASSPAPEWSPSVAIERRIRDARDHQKWVQAELLRLHPDAVVVANDAQTRAAIAQGADLIVNAVLVDGEGERRSAVTALVRLGRVGETFSYAPLMARYNEMTEDAATKSLHRGSLAALLPHEATEVAGLNVRRTVTMVKNGMSLCHATRVLETFASGDPDHRGALVDRHANVWWFQLDDPQCGRWTLGHYDLAYRERLRILNELRDWQRGEREFPTKPFWHRECVECPYGASCHEQLDALDDVSLIRFTSYEQQEKLRAHGINTRHDLARLRPQLVTPLRDRSPVLASLDNLDASSERAPSKRERNNVDLSIESRLAPSIERLEDLIYRARAFVQGQPLLIQSAHLVSCPRADVEVDVDMESYDDVTYLWGAYVSTSRSDLDVPQGYHSFVSWRADLDAPGETQVFLEFWQWFDALRQHTHQHGASFAAYCFWAQAEDGAMNRATQFEPAIRDHVDEFRSRQPPQWIDMHHVVKEQIQTEGPLGLKSLASSAGFAWRDPDPSGEASLSWYEEAIGDSPAALAARRRLLEYNEDDCRATLALRDWLTTSARDLRHRDDDTFADSTHR